MRRWVKVRAVAAFEFLSSVKRPGYLIATFGMPVFLLLYGGVISMIGLFFERRESQIQLYGVIDRPGVLRLVQDTSGPDPDIPAEIRSALELASPGARAGAPVGWWDNFVFRPFDGLEQAKRSLLEGEIKGVYVIPEDYLRTGRVEVYSGERADFEGSESRTALRNLLLDRLLEGRVAGELAERVRKPIASHQDWTVTSAGMVEERSVAGVLAKLLVPIVFTILLFVSLMMSASYLLQGTAIEKENKLVEVLLSSANPDEILAGKLLGLCGAGLLQVVVWFGMVASSGLILAGALQLGGVEIPWSGMVIGLFFFLAGYLFLGSLMLGTGSLGNNVRESQQFSMVWTLLTIVPLMFLQILIFEPHATFARVMTWIPFTAPVTVILRTTLEPEGIGWWEVAGSFAMMLLATWLAIRFGASLFRVGLLLTGARPKLRDVLRQARL